MKKIVFPVLLGSVVILLTTSAVVIHSGNQTKTSASSMESGPKQKTESPPSSNRVSSKALQETLEVFSATPVEIPSLVHKEKLVLATNEFYVRNPDGGEVVILPTGSGPAELAAAMETSRAETGREPELVLYPAGFPRNEFTRRIVTREVVITAPTRGEADAIATEKGLVFLKAPAFAPNAFVYEAATSASVLAASATEGQDSRTSLIPLLAKQATRLVMPNDPYLQLQWHLKFQNQLGAMAGTDINVESVWNYPSISANNSIRGRNVAIGILDDGMDWSHPDLFPNVKPELQYDWNGKDYDPKPSNFDDNHGTACAGVAAARGNNRIGVSGVAPEAKLVGMRLIAGPVTDLDTAEALVWKHTVGKNASGEPEDQIEVKSNSWGYYAFSENLWDGLFAEWNPLVENGELVDAALKYAADFGRAGKGTIVTFAAGNHDERDIRSGGKVVTEKSGARVDFQALPNSIYTIAVGAVNSVGVKSNYSQVGSSLLISAPSNTTDGSGLGIMTTDNKGAAGYNYGVFKPLGGQPVNDFKGSGDVTQTFGGTSSACPVVSGVVALMLEKNPNLGWRDVQEILIRSANNTFDPVGWTTNAAGISFNDNYGAGLVNAAAAVALSGNWTNLKPQKFQTATSNTVVPIAANSTITHTFSVNGTDLRTEHTTLELTISDIPKGNLTITLTSPGNTTSTFCLPHSDTTNKFTNWKFMSVRNWAENSNGNWTLSITNHGATPGNLELAELVVYGAERVPSSANPAPVVTIQASHTKVFTGANITLNATAIDQNGYGTRGTIAKVEFFANDGNGVFSMGNATSEPYTLSKILTTAGNHTFYAKASDGATPAEITQSASVVVQVDPLPLAGWDFDSENVALGTAIQGNGTYAADFGNGSGQMVFNGTFEGPVLDSPNRWDFDRGEIFVGNGTSLNSVGTFETMALDNKALLLRGGKNLSAEGKWIVFKFDMSGYSNLRISYATTGDPKLVNGFTRHEWEWSSDGANWFAIEDISIPTGLHTPDNLYGYSQVEVDGNPATPGLDPITNLDDSPDGYVRVRFTGADRLAPQGENWIDNIVFAADPIPGIDVETLGASSSLPSAKVDDSEVSSVIPPGVSDVFNEEPVSNTLPASIVALGWKAPEPKAFRMDVSAQVVSGAELLEVPGSALAAFDGETLVGLSQPLETGSVYSLVIWSDTAATDPLRLRAYDAATGNVHVLAEKQVFTAGASLGTATVPVRFQSAYLEASETHSVGPGSNTLRFRVLPEDPTVENVFADYQASAGDEFRGQSGSATRGASGWVPKDLTIAGGVPVELVRKAATPTSFRITGMAVEASVVANSEPSITEKPSSPETVVPVTTQTPAPAQVSSTPATPTYTPSGPSGPSEFKKTGKSAKSKKKKFKKSKRNFSN